MNSKKGKKNVVTVEDVILTGIQTLTHTQTHSHTLYIFKIKH